MLLQTPIATLPEAIGPWLAVIAFGAYHGLNPGMGWLFAVSMGLQQRSERAIWTSFLPIAAGHAASIALIALLIVAGVQLISTSALQIVTALVLLGFGLYKIVRYYRHPRWVGMKINFLDLTWWSFLMAVAHGAGLMVAPALVAIAANDEHQHHMHASGGTGGVFMGVAAHTLAMLVVMALIAWLVYRRWGLSVLRSRWVNFDLIWAVALLLVGALSLVGSVVR